MLREFGMPPQCSVHHLHCVVIVAVTDRIEQACFECICDRLCRSLREFALSDQWFGQSPGATRPTLVNSGRDLREPLVKTQLFAGCGIV